jgi:hypothetical protein
MTHVTSFDDFQRGDRIRFVTWRQYVGGFRHGMVWRTGTVQLATSRALTIACDIPNPIGRRAVIKREEWEQRCPEKL